jgi:UDP-2,3-diacylglucosamine hydrolase
MQIGLKNERCFFSADFHLHPHSNSVVLEKYLELFNEGDRCFFLGDFFEVWYENRSSIPVGYENILGVLKKASSRGVFLHLIKGNRDFLAGEKLIENTGMILHEDPVLLFRDDLKILLIHGDELLSEDVNYQKYKKIIRSKFIVGLSKRLPQFILKKISGELRVVSKNKTENLTANAFTPDFKLLDELIKSEKITNILAGHLHKKMELRNDYEHGVLVANVLEQSSADKINYKILKEGVFSEDLIL